MIHPLLLKPIGEIAGDIGRAVVAEQPWLVDDLGPITARRLEGQRESFRHIARPHGGAQLAGDDVTREVVEDALAQCSLARTGRMNVVMLTLGRWQHPLDQFDVHSGKPSRRWWADVINRRDRRNAKNSLQSVNLTMPRLAGEPDSPCRLCSRCPGTRTSCAATHPSRWADPSQRLNSPSTAQTHTRRASVNSVSSPQ